MKENAIFSSGFLRNESRRIEIEVALFLIAVIQTVGEMLGAEAFKYLFLVGRS